MSYLNQSIQSISFLREASAYFQSYRKQTFVIVMPSLEALEGAFKAEQDRVHLGHQLAHQLVADILLLESLSIRCVLVLGCEEGLRHSFHPVISAQKALDLGQKLKKQSDFWQSVFKKHDASLKLKTRLQAILDIRLKTFGTHLGTDHQHLGELMALDKQAFFQLSQSYILMLDTLQTLQNNPHQKKKHTTLWAQPDGFALQLAQMVGADKVISFWNGLSHIPSQVRFSPKGGLFKGGAVSYPSQNNTSVPSFSDAFKRCGLPFNLGQEVYSALTENSFSQKPRRLHFLPLHQNSLLAELFSIDGVGFMANGDEYEQIRKATSQDKRALEPIFGKLAQQGLLAERRLENLNQHSHTFWVIERDGRLIGSVGFRLLSQSPYAVGELFSLWIDEAYRHQSKASALSDVVQSYALKQGVKTLIARTTRAEDWFVSYGFKLLYPGDLARLKIEASDLPDYQQCRQSKLYGLDLVSSV